MLGIEKYKPYWYNKKPLIPGVIVMPRHKEIDCDDRIPSDEGVLSGLKAYKYDQNHSHEQIQAALATTWPFVFTITSVHTLNQILSFVSIEQRKTYIDTILDTFPPCSSQEWIIFLSYCSQEQCQHFLQKLSISSCFDLYNDFFVALVNRADKFSLERLEQILSYIHSKFSRIVPSNFELHVLSFVGGTDESKRIEKMRLILKCIQPDLSRLTLSVEALAQCFSTKGLDVDESRWTAIVKTYFVGLAPHLPSIFKSTWQEQVLYRQLNNQSNTLVLLDQMAYSPKTIQSKFAQYIQDCLTHLPNAYQFVSKYKSSADSLMGFLVQYAIERPAIILDADSDPVQHEFHQFIHRVMTVPRYTSNCLSKSPEDQLIDDLSNLDPYWLTILNDHIPLLNWNSALNVNKTKTCFRAYIRSVQAVLDEINKSESVSNDLIIEKLNQYNNSHPEFVKACHNMLNLLNDLKQNKKTEKIADYLLKKTNRLMDNPGEYQSFLAEAKKYREVAGGKLTAYIMLIGGWAAKIATLGTLGDIWIKQANEKLRKIDIVETLVMESGRRHTPR